MEGVCEWEAEDSLGRDFIFKNERTEVIDVMKEWVELKAIEKEEIEVDKKIEGYLKEIR